MFKAAKFATLAILSVLSLSAYAADNEKSAAMVNGVSIPQARVDLFVKRAAQQGEQDSPELRKKIREGLIDQEILAQEAKSKKLDKQPEVIEQMESARQNILANSYAQDYVKTHPISDDQLKLEYDKLGGKEYNVRHILVETEEEAAGIIAKLDKKAKFNNLAKKSKDAGSAEHGGSLGWTQPNRLAPPFASALTELKKGTYTKKPVQTQFGWHVIKLDDVRDLKVPPFEELKPQLEQFIQQQAIQKAVIDLREKAKIE